jgi:hypothetical protein
MDGGTSYIRSAGIGVVLLAENIHWQSNAAGSTSTSSTTTTPPGMMVTLQDDELAYVHVPLQQQHRPSGMILIRYFRLVEPIIAAPCCALVNVERRKSAATNGCLVSSFRTNDSISNSVRQIMSSLKALTVFIWKFAPSALGPTERLDSGRRSCHT